MNTFKNELIQIVDIENATPLSWFDWWNYWSTSIGIIVFIAIFLILTIAYYSINPSKNTELKIVETQQEENMDKLVTNILSQKALTL